MKSNWNRTKRFFVPKAKPRPKEKAKQKDSWDKADIIAKFISSVVIASIGIYLTSTIQRTQIEFSKSTADHDVKIKQASLTNQLIEHLTSADTVQRKIAIIALKGNMPEKAYNEIIGLVAIGDRNTAVRLTAIEQLASSQSKSSMVTLTKISQNNNLSSDERKTALEGALKVALKNESNSNWCFLGAGEMAFESPAIQGGFFTHNLISGFLDLDIGGNVNVKDLFLKIQNTSPEGQEYPPVLTCGSRFDTDINIFPNNNTKYLIIGASDYKRNEASLLYSANDANRLKDVLIDAFDIKTENIFLCINPTKIQLHNFLESVSKGIDKKSNVVIYYSGQSALSESKGLELVPVDSNFEHAENVPVNELYGYFPNCGYLLVFWDACTYKFK